MQKNAVDGRDHANGWRSAPPPRRKKDGEWASTPAQRDLTPEEQALKNALQSQKSNTPPSRPFTIKYHQGREDEAPEPRPGYPPSTARVQEAVKSPPNRGHNVLTEAIERRRVSRDAPDLRSQPSSAQRSAPSAGTARPSASQRRPENQKSRLADRGAQNRTESRDDEQRKYPVESWKHVRRIPAKGREERPSTTDPEHLRVSPKAKAIELERLQRLEETRNSDFVGFRGGKYGRAQTAGPSPKIQRDLPDVQPMTANKDHATSDSSKAGDGWKRWKPLIPTESRSGDSSTYREPSKAVGALHGWEYPVEETNASVTGGMSCDPKLEESTTSPVGGLQGWEYSAKETYVPTTNDDSYDLKIKEDTEPHQYARNEPRESEQRLRGSGIEQTTMPYGRKSRYTQRKTKNKQFLSDIDQGYDEPDDVRAERRKGRKEQRKKAEAAKKARAPPTPIYLPEFISVSNLAGVLKVRVEDFLSKLKDLGFDEFNNDHVLDAETAGLVAAEFNFEPVVEGTEDEDLLPLPPAEDKSVLPARPPVVTIMGHVDHGKTTMLDFLRKSSVAASEHGGITQHIGAFSVPMSGGRLVTFLDTPGHEAFLSMRQRGANVTDVVILVVAADDSVKPQTIEAIRHAQGAKVPMIVAANKIDKEDSNVERVKQDLARYGVEIEDYGGDTQVVCVSGKTGQGMEEMEDAIVALADIIDMRSEVNGQAEGWVLEATTKKAGRVATILVRRGTLRPGDVIVAGTSWARVRSLRNEAGIMIPSAGPGTPAEIDGWREQPTAGDEVIQAPDEQKAKSAIAYRLETSERTKMAADMEAVNETRRLEQEKREQLEKAAELAAANLDAPPLNAEPSQDSSSTSTPVVTPTSQEVFFVIKADVSGSVEAVTDSVSALGNSEVRPYILRSDVGPVTEFDVDHAAVAKGHIINFNTTIEGQIQRMAESKDVKIIDQSIIYRLVDEVKALLSAKLPPSVTQRVLGEAEVAQVFEINTKGRVTVPVAGCKVRNGIIAKTAKVRVLRDKDIVFDGMLPLSFYSSAMLL